MSCFMCSWFIEHIELPAKLLDYFLRSNKSNINQYYEATHPMQLDAEKLLDTYSCTKLTKNYCTMVFCCGGDLSWMPTPDDPGRFARCTFLALQFSLMWVAARVSMPDMRKNPAHMTTCVQRLTKRAQHLRPCMLCRCDDSRGRAETVQKSCRRNF